jgi:anti-sigma B factor antagonist
MRRISAKDVAQPLRMELEQHQDTVVLLASGEIDVAHADRLRTRLLELIEAFRRVVLDLRGVEFIDSTGLHCVLEIEAASQAAGVEFMLIRGPARVQRLFELTGTHDRLRFVDGVDGIS